MKKLLWIGMGLLMCSGCAALKGPLSVQASPVLDAVGAIASDLTDVKSEIGNVSGTIHRIDQSVRTNDDWTVRILAAAPWVAGTLVFGYPVGKLVWLAGARVLTRAPRSAAHAKRHTVG